MRQITILNADKIEVRRNYQTQGSDALAQGGMMMDASDGDHTFSELYEHRHNLFIALCKHVVERGVLSVWKSKLHADGKGYDGWFVIGINKEKGKQISYHLPISKWEETEFIETLEKAPEWDGHDQYEVIKRLKSL